MIEGIPAVLVGVGLLLLAMGSGMPVFVAFLVVNLGASMLLLGPAGFGMFSGSFFETATSSSLVTIPLFILMGELLFRSRAVEVLFQSIDTLVGRVRGRQFILSIVLATVFSTLSGAAMGVAAMLGRSLLPGMVSRGYDARLSIGTILAGASLAPLIPPSVLVIIIGTLAGVSIAGLLIAGIIPGLVFSSLFAAYVFIRIWRNPTLAPADEDAKSRPSLLEAATALIKLLPFTIIIALVMGLILMGVATPTEAGAMGVLGSLMTAAIYRNLSIRMVVEAVGESAKISAMILIIMASSKLFSQLLAFSGGASALTQWIVELQVSSWFMLFMLMLLPFILCMFIDQIALMLIVIPIYLPIIDRFEYDPIWFWLLFLVNITVGGITPPFGYTLFALKSAWNEGSLSSVFAAAWPFVGLFVIGMVLLALVPELTTLLPSML